jgi:nicotinate-nucleotide adenylyltransferase
MRGILGGTFDPIHHGHLRLALEVQAAFDLDAVHLVLSAQPPHRASPSISAAARFDLLQKAVENEAMLIADDREMQRADLSYMVETLAHFRTEFGKKMPLGLILGADAWLKFESWYQWQTILDYCHVIIVQRPNYTEQMPASLGQIEQQRRAKLPQQLQQQPAGLIYRQTTSALDISATMIRDVLASGGNPRYLLPDNVLNSIKNAQFYL